jgi:hypothetical protein
VYLVDSLLLGNETNPEEYTAMNKNNVVELSGRDQFTDSLTELLRTGARQLIQQAVEAELAEFMAHSIWTMDGPQSFVMVINRYEARSRVVPGSDRAGHFPAAFFA